MNIALCGFMGAGKTSVGRDLAKITGMDFVDTDELAEQLLGMPAGRAIEELGEQRFRDAEFEACREAAKLKNTVISTGGGAAVYERNVAALKGGAKIVFIDTPFSIICKRVGSAETRPLFKNRESALRLFNERRSKYLAAADIVVFGGASVRKIARTIAEELSLEVRA